MVLRDGVMADYLMWKTFGSKPRMTVSTKSKKESKGLARYVRYPSIKHIADLFLKKQGMDILLFLLTWYFI